MHVLIAAHNLYPDPGSGGTGRYIYETARRLVDRGHDVSVITRRRGGAPSHETVAGIDVFRYDISIAGERADGIARQLPRAARDVLRYVNQARIDGKPDVVSFQGPITSLLVHVAADGDVPRSTTFHSPWATEYAIKTSGSAAVGRVRRGLNVRLRRLAEGYVLSRAADSITLSEYMRGELVDAYDADLDPTVIPGGVDTDRFRPDAGTYAPLDGDGFSVLTVRRLSERMGHGLLLEAFAAVVDSRPDAELYIAGDGPRRTELERRAVELGVDDRTTFLGYVPDRDLPAAYATADAFALPTTELEGFGLTALEALASGTPVVATPVGGTVEVVGAYERGANVPEPMLVESANPDALARGLLSWSDLPAGARADAGAACRTVTTETFSWERTADRLESHYADLSTSDTPRRRESVSEP